MKNYCYLNLLNHKTEVGGTSSDKLPRPISQASLWIGLVLGKYNKITTKPF